MDRQYNNTRQGSGSGGPGSGPGPNPNKNGRNGIIQHSQPSRQFQAVPYTQEEHSRIQEQLNKVLGPEYVSIRPGGGGQNVSYIEGWKALNLANEVFGFNGWSSELISTQVDYFDTHGNRFSMGLSVVVRITIKDGTYHEDFGYGFIDNAKSKAMAFEKCKKEAFTDGLKRCLRCFGNVLGNCLYDRTIMAKIQKVKLPPVQLEEENFHRDPLLVKREERKKHIQTVNILEDRDTNGNNGESKATNSSENPTTKGDPANGSPQAKMDIAKDFDDSLLFSDDQPADTEAKSPKGIDASELQMIFHEDRGFSQEQSNNEDDVPHFSDDFDTSSRQSAPPTMGGEVTTPKQVTSPLFVSAKSADLVQQGDPKADVPKYDTKFVSQSIRRTIDPMKSVPVKRSEVRPSANHLTPLASKSNNSLNLNSASLGKRMIGLPPSQQPKRRRADDKENQ